MSTLQETYQYQITGTHHDGNIQSSVVIKYESIGMASHTTLSSLLQSVVVARQLFLPENLIQHKF